MPVALVPWPASVRELEEPPLRPAAHTAAGRRPLAASLARTAIRSTAPECGAEGYRLRVDAHGVAIAAGDEAGFFYAEQTLAQLIDVDGDGPLVPAVEIVDTPRFAYRGLMLDVARHFHSVATLEAVIDRAASLKLNALHLHLTDDQGWRLDVDSHPELAARASSTSALGDPGGFFTRDDYRRIVTAAAAHHMIVVPEIDLPGHTHALGLSHPELVADPVVTEQMREVHALLPGQGELPRRGAPYTGIAVGFSSLRADAPGLEPFLREVLGEIAAQTPGPYLHFGGDEALGISAGDYREIASLAARIVAETGKTPVAWHEAGVADLPAGTIGQYWGYVSPREGHDDDARSFVENGGRLILSPADAVYLDMKYDADTRIGLTWADGPTSVERSYRWEPAHVLADVPESAILGVEAALWSETVRDLRDIDHLMFPRVGSAAEAAWSPPAGSPERVWASFRRRIGGLAPLWSEEGIGFHRSPEVAWRDEPGPGR